MEELDMIEEEEKRSRGAQRGHGSEKDETDPEKSGAGLERETPLDKGTGRGLSKMKTPVDRQTGRKLAKVTSNGSMIF
jgi:hypothetical protein